jgi:hypothetical protein
MGGTNMIKMKKLFAMSVGLIMTTSLLSGCSYDGLALINAFGKTQSINSMEAKTDISVKVSGSNMSEMEEQMMASVLPTINGTKMFIVTKTSQNSEKTISKVQSDISVQLGQMPGSIDMGFWADMDMSKDKPVMKEVFKIPGLLSTQLPKELQGKDYMVMDLAKMTSTPDMPQVNYDKLMSFSKEFQPEFLDFIVKYAKQFNPTTDYIKYAGRQRFLVDGKMQSTVSYEVKLTDKSFKDLMHYTLTNLSENEDAMNFVQKFMTSTMSIYDIDDAEAGSSQNEMNKAIKNMETEWPAQLANMNKALESIDDLKILGDNGIKIRYTVNEDGYIIKEEGNVEFVIDLPSIIKLAGNSETASSPSNPTGIYTIGVDFNTDTTNINGDVDIVMPKVNSINSFNYSDILKMMPTGVPQEMPTEIPAVIPAK